MSRLLFQPPVFALLLLGCSENVLRNLPDEVPTTTGEAVVEPVADAGSDGKYSPLDEVRLDGRGSFDPAGLRIVAAKWTVVSIPAGSTAALSDPTDLEPVFFADLAGAYVFALTVQNEEGTWDSTPDEVLVTTIPLDGFYVELSWNSESDLDLHLLDGTTPLFGDGDCNYCNLTPSWGEPGRDDDPSLDIDAMHGFGPETITIDTPSAGLYNVQVHYYGETGVPSCNGPCAPSEATINIYLGGIELGSFKQILDDQGDVWDVADIEWPSGRITEIGGLSSTDKTSCL